MTRFTSTYLHSLVTGDFEIKEHIRIKDLLSLERGGGGVDLGKAEAEGQEEYAAGSDRDGR